MSFIVIVYCVTSEWANSKGASTKNLRHTIVTRNGKTLRFSPFLVIMVTLSGFWPRRGRGGGGLSESSKKGKFLTKIFFSDNVEWISKNL